MGRGVFTIDLHWINRSGKLYASWFGWFVVFFFFRRVSNRITLKAVDVSYHVFFQVRQKGLWCRALWASLPASSASCFFAN